jgi:hypothetical protein
MKIWEVLRPGNLYRKYKVAIHNDYKQEVSVEYDGNSDYLTVKQKKYPPYPLESLRLGRILELEFEEIKEEIDWTTIPVDTLIEVKDIFMDKWVKRYFAKYDRDLVYAWNNGATSITAEDNNDIYGWDEARLPIKKD